MPVIAAPFRQIPDLWVTPFSEDSIGRELVNTVAGAYGSSVYPTANMAIYVPWWVTEPVLVTKLGAGIGGVSSGNLDIGIYNSAALLPTTKVITAGATAVGTISTAQEVNIADTALVPALYFLAFWCSNTTAAFQRVQLGGGLQVGKLLGICSEIVASNLPATATPVTASQSYMPEFGAVMDPRTLLA